MTSVAIIGAGQSGGRLALGLLAHGYEVTLVSDRSPEEIRSGNVLSGQCMFDIELAAERELGIDEWASSAPWIDSLAVSAAGETRYAWSAPLGAPAQSVDQRLTSAAWAERVAQHERGTLVTQAADVATLEEYAHTHDLVIVASARGDLARLFRPDPVRSRFDRPQRVFALAYVKGMEPRPDGTAFGFTFIPGVGEYCTFPALTTSGPCDVMMLAGVPGGPLDRWDDVADPEQHLARSLDMLATFVPDEWDRSKDVVLTDEGAVLRERMTPAVRVPVVTLPSGRPVLGMGEAVVLNDPLTGQGGNLAAHAASHYLNAILRNRAADFGESWMHRTFESFWHDRAQWVVEWTNSLLVEQPAYRAELLQAAAESPALAAAIAAGFEDPRRLFQWWFDEAAAERFRTRAIAAHDGGIDPRELRRALSQFATGVTVVTARGRGGRRVGMTANSFTSVSLDPPLVLWCPRKAAPSLADFADATHFAVNVLAAGQEPIAHQFATPAADKFADLELAEGAGGAPVLTGVVAQFECRTVQSMDAGDHVIFIGEVESFRAGSDSPLIFHSGVMRAL